MPSISDIPSPIMSCKLVCKLWCSLINHPKFCVSSEPIPLITPRFCNNVTHKNTHLIEPELNYIENQCLMLGNKALVFNIFERYNGVSSWYVLNSCNGLVCFARSTRSWGGFAVCNPVMSDYVIVKHLPLGVWPMPISGFGFSPKSNQYKLFYFVNNRKLFNEFLLMAYVYTMGNDDCWRSVKNQPPQDFISAKFGKCMYLAGVLHWIAQHKRSYSCSIVALDCHEETFVVMDLPELLGSMTVGNPSETIQLAILHSRLCFCNQIARKSGHYDVWIMDEYGVKESWRKLLVVSACESLDTSISLRPLKNLKNGEILMLSQYGKLFSYDVKSETWRAIEIPGIATKVEATLFDPIFIPTKNLIMRGNSNLHIVESTNM